MSASARKSPPFCNPHSQTLFVVLLLPVTTTLARVPLHQLPDYMVQGSQCLASSPLLPLAYVFTNLLFNISMLLLRWVYMWPVFLPGLSVPCCCATTCSSVNISMLLLLLLLWWCWVCLHA